MDVKHRYIKSPDFREIRAEDGRMIRVFTLSNHPVWLTCIYDEERDITWKTPHLDYEAAYNDFVTFCKLLERKADTGREEEVQCKETPKRASPQCNHLWWVVIGLIVYLILRFGGGQLW